MSDSDLSPDTITPKPPVREKAMGFWDHLEELRGTIIKSAIVFIIFACLIGYFIQEFNEALMWPLLSTAAKYPGVSVKLGTTTIMEVFNMIIQMCFLGSATLSAPLILFFVAQFVAPALTEKEMKAVLPLCISATILFLIGSTFSFFVLVPATCRMGIELNESFHLELRWTVASYYSTLMWLVLGVGGAFEFPLVLVLLIWLGIMTTAFLRKYRRHAIVAIFIIAAIITPTPDPITQTLFAAPLYALYELSIIVGSRVEKKRAAARAA